MAFELRPYQTDIIGEARTLMRSGIKSILITAPTGSGKTVLTASMLQTSSERGIDSLFMVHRRELIKQSTATFSAVGVRHGIIAAGFPLDLNSKVQIGSIGTMVNRIGKIREPKLIIWDECHHLAAGQWSKIFKAYPNAFHIGLTATPERLDGKGLRPFFQHMIRGPEVKWLIEEGYLCNYIIYCPPGGVSMEGVKKSMGDFNKKEVSALYDKPTILGNTVKLYRKHVDLKRAIVFCPSVQYSEHLQNEFQDNNIRAFHVDGETDDRERDLRISQFKNDEIKLLLNVGLFGEGFDVPAIDAVIDTSPTMSLSAYLQRFGRALRPIYAPGFDLKTREGRLGAIAASPKPFAVYLDQAGNVDRHQFPDDVREWNLDGRGPRSKQSNEVSIRTCKKCYAALKLLTKVCPYCAYIFEVESRVIEEVEGDLVLIDPEEVRRNRAREQGSAQSEQELIELGRKRGYKRPEAWARHLIIARNRTKR
jgi:DNA repair protein RadD